MGKSLMIIDLIEAVLHMATSFGINVAKLNEMREQNGGAPLTAAQREELANDAQSAIDRM